MPSERENILANQYSWRPRFLPLAILSTIRNMTCYVKIEKLEEIWRDGIKWSGWIFILSTHTKAHRRGLYTLFILVHNRLFIYLYRITMLHVYFRSQISTEHTFFSRFNYFKLARMHIYFQFSLLDCTTVLSPKRSILISEFRGDVMNELHPYIFSLSH